MPDEAINEVEQAEKKHRVGLINIEATSGYLKEKGIEKVSVDYDFGENLDESIDLFSADVVHSNFVANAAITLQSNLRRWAKKFIEDGGTLDDGGVELSEHLQNKANGWVIGVISREKMSKVDKAAKLLDGMSKEQLEKYLEIVRSKAASVEE